MKQTILVMVLLVLLSISGCGLTGYSVRQDSMKFGATLPLTGPLAMYGSEINNGIVLATEEINSKGGVGRRAFEVVVMDNQGSTPKSISDANYLINVENVLGLFTTFEPSTLAIKDIVEAQKRVMIGFTVYRFNDSTDYSFRDYWDMGRVGSEFGKVSKSRGSKTVGLIAQTDSSHEQFKEGFEQGFGSSINTVEMFELGQTDFRTSLLKLRDLGLDTLVVYGFPLEVSSVLRQLDELGMDDYNLLVTEATESFVYSGNEKILQGAVSYQNVINQEGNEFNSRYQSRFGKVPRPDAYYAYSDTILLARLAGECGKQGQVRVDCVRDGLLPYFEENHNNYSPSLTDR